MSDENGGVFIRPKSNRGRKLNDENPNMFLLLFCFVLFCLFVCLFFYRLCKKN